MATSWKKPPGPSGTLGVRNLSRFARDPLGFLTECRERYGDVVHIPAVQVSWTVLNDPEDVERLFLARSESLKKDRFIDFLKWVLGEGLLTSEGELWRRQRHLAAHAFTPRRIKTYARSMVEAAERMVAGFRDGEVIDVHREMFRVTLDVVAKTLFDGDVSGSAGEVGEAMEVISDYYAKSPELLLGVPRWVPTPRHLEFGRAVQVVDEVVGGFIAERRASGEDRGDLLSALLLAQGEGGEGMSDRQLRDECVTLFLAGHETTALTLAHALYLLSTHPEVARRVFEEVDRVLGGRAPSEEDVPKLRYLDAVLKETLRLYPTAPMTGREVIEPFEVKGYVVPKGEQLVVSQWVMHRDRRFFPNPEAFDPSRWEEDLRRKLPRYAYFPFGGGPRVCIGNHFATLEAALILATLCQRFRLDVEAGQSLAFSPSVTLRPKRTIKMRVVARAPAAARRQVAAASAE
jgi:cytochrome P450